MNVAVLVPVKAFTAAKQRMSPLLSPAERIRFARWMADGVLAAVADLDVFVACDDEEVRTWAQSRGANALWGPGLGLNGAVDDGVRQIALAGYDHVIVTHADLPRPSRLVSVARRDTTTLVPDRRRDGTNVMSFPTAEPISATYGAGSFERHLRQTASHRRRRGAGHVEIRSDPHLSLDADTPHDLTHPLLIEVLPSWLPTTPANHSTPAIL